MNATGKPSVSADGVQIIDTTHPSPKRKLCIPIAMWAPQNMNIAAKTPGKKKEIKNKTAMMIQYQVVIETS